LWRREEEKGRGGGGGGEEAPAMSTASLARMSLILWPMVYGRRGRFSEPVEPSMIAKVL
jgi:hypothetical protein